MAALLWLHLRHCVSEGSSFLLAGAAFTAIKSTGCLQRESGVWKLSDGKEKRTLKMCWGVCLKKRKKEREEPQSSVVNVASLWPFHIRRVRFVTSKGPHYYPQPPQKASPQISFKWAALSATYIPSECFSLLHFYARLIWRTLFSRRLWPCLYFDIRCKRKQLCPLFRFHLYTLAVNLRVVLARRSMEYLLARGLLGEAAAYQLGL